MAIAAPEAEIRRSEIPQHQPVPRLLVELPSWRGTFVANLRDSIFPRRQPHLELRSAPAAFWPDVFVTRDLPWSRFVQSVVLHVIAGALLITLTRFFAMQPRVIALPAFEHNQVVVYQPSEYLPPLDTRSEKSAEPARADPELARQPIISVPREADNRSQTIVTPPNVKLKRDVAVPNIVAWSDKQEKPSLYIPPVPLTPAAEITRLTPQIANSVVAPPPDATQLSQRRNLVALQSSVVAPPPDLQVSRTAPALKAPQASLIAPPPSVTASTRVLGNLNIGHTAVINPAPQLTVGEQRAIAGGRSGELSGTAPQVVAPPPSIGASGSAGSPGRMIALSLHPAVGAPPNPPQGNRRGAFAASPEGHAGASGTPGAASGNATGSGSLGTGSGKDAGSGGKGKSDLPAGLYVGSAGAAKTSPVAGDPAPPTSQPKTNLTASVHPPRVSTASPASGSVSKLTEAERDVFGDRKFYSMTLNMPNLNSAGGSWVVHFTEQEPSFNPHSADATAQPTKDDLSEPMATRKVDPAYPLQLMRENVSGTVILYAVIRADGSVGNVRVLRGVDDRLDHFATQAVAQWQFSPATKNGSPVAVEATFQIPFKPPKVGTNF